MAVVETIAGIYRLISKAAPSRGPGDYPQLATVDADGVARTRLVILRGFDAPQRRVWVCTNVFAKKVAQLTAQQTAEMTLWLARPRVQLRLLCTWKIARAETSDPELQRLRDEEWQRQSPYAKVLYHWPAGTQDPAEILARLPSPQQAEALPMPGGYCLLVGTITRIDALQLTRPLHHRWVYEWDAVNNAWQGARRLP
jgi:pyridoxine/pyridoxamine 5'-phosphate oxidase